MKSRYWLAAVIALLWLMLLATREGFSQAEGSVQASEEQKLVPSEFTESFGRSVAVSGDVTVVGSARQGDVPGAVYVFRFEGATAKWREEEVLLASDGEATDGFGDSVAISGDVALVGAPLDDETAGSSGSAYVFRYDGVNWLQEAKFQAFDGQHGNSVAVSGDVAVVGATDHAHVFRHDGVEWTEEQILVASDLGLDDLFGNSVAIDGDVIVVGSERDDANGTNTGSAYVYGYDGMMWLEEAKLLASDGRQVSNFGRSVGISGDVIIVGVLELPFGGAYIYRFDGSSWLEETKLLPSDPAFDDRFGFSVAVSGDLAVVGAWAHFHGADGSGARPGGAYVFRYDGATWVERAELRASDAGAGDRLGESVGISRDVTVAGAPGDDDDPDDDAGSGYAFRGPDLTCTADCRDFVTLVNPASNSTQESVLRIVNRAETTTEITIEAFDDAGSAAAGGRIHATLAPRASQQLTAQDLEQGNTEKGLFGSLGDGIGKWQLEVRSDGVIEVISLIRTPDGFLTSVDDIAPKTSRVNEIYIARVNVTLVPGAGLPVSSTPESVTNPGASD